MHLWLGPLGENLEAATQGVGLQGWDVSEGGQGAGRLAYGYIRPRVAPNHNPTVAPNHNPTVAPNHNPTVAPNHNPLGNGLAPWATARAEGACPALAEGAIVLALAPWLTCCMRDVGAVMRTAGGVSSRSST